MTDVLDRRAQPEIDDLEALVTAPTRTTREVSLFGRAALASLMIGAAVIHFVMVPQHLDEWTAEGVAFIAAAWVQVVLAVLVFRYATRAILWTGIALNALFVFSWAFTRIAGQPFGPHDGIAESAGFVDVTCTVFEGLFVLGALFLLFRPSFARSARGRKGWVAGIIPLIVLGFTTAAVASPGALTHSHGGDGNTGAETTHDHPGGEAAKGALPTHSHDEGGEHGDDRGLGMLSNGHHAEMQVVALDALTQAKLDEQLALTRQVAATYPTLADAVAAGYTRQGPFSPGLGIHYGKYSGPEYMNGDGVVDREDALHPMTIIYDGTEPTSKVAGFMYYSFAPLDKMPEGFIGPNDTWHYHTNTCIKPSKDGIDAPLGADQSVTQEQCQAVGGTLMPTTNWMVHVWTVPGYEVAEADGGTFAEVNPALTCPDGTYFIRPVEEWPDHLLNVCQSAP
jgi:hypothetical protein